MRECVRWLLTHPDLDLDATAAATSSCQLAQLTLFVVEYALARTMVQLGVRPAAVIGHSLGQYIAAVVGGALSLPAALQLILLRGTLLDQMRPGAMIAVRLSEERWRQVQGELASLSAASSSSSSSTAAADDGTAGAVPASSSSSLFQSISLASVNAPASLVLSGPTSAISALGVELTRRGIHHKAIAAASKALHSAEVDTIRERFVQAATSILDTAAATTTMLVDGGQQDPCPPTMIIPVVCNLTGRLLAREDPSTSAASALYWFQHMRGTVRYADGLRTLQQRFADDGGGRVVWVEMGASSQTKTFLRAIQMADAAATGGADPQLERAEFASAPRAARWWRNCAAAVAQ